MKTLFTASLLLGIFASGASILTSSASAASTQVWEISDRKDFLPGEFEGTALDAEGLLRPGRRLQSLFDAEEAAVWTAAEASDGSLYFGSGHQGKLYRIAKPGAEAKVVWDAPEMEIFAIEPAEKRDVFVATAPKGKVYRVRPNGKADVLFEPNEEYVWSLQRIGKTLYVGTGLNGKVYRVPLDGGEPAEHFSSGQRHVTSLAADAEGRLLVGTDPNGILYRVDPDGTALALYDADLPEIRSVTVGPDGAVYFAAMGGAISLVDQTTQGVTAAFSVTATASGGTSSAGLTGAAPSPQPVVQSQPQVYSSPIVNYGVETAAVYRLEPGRSAEKIWTSKEENVLGLARDPGRPDALAFAADQSGRIYSLRTDGEAELIHQALGKNLSGLWTAGERLVVTALRGGQAFTLDSKPEGSGVYRTAPRDAGGIAQWGRLEAKSDGEVRFRTRSGAVARPDAAWSPWVEATDGRAIASPPSRYLQWEAILEPGASLERVRVAYLPQNRPPLLSAVTVSSAAAPQAAASSNGASSASTAAAYSITVSASAGGSSTSSATSTDQQALSGASGGALKIEWIATDPDDDALRATVEFRGDDETEWKRIEREVETSQVSIDRDALADGRYRFRVTVSDGTEETDRISRPVLLDRTPPVVRLISRDARDQARFEAEDQASMIAKAEMSVDAGPWRPIESDDRILDSKTEAFTVSLQDLEPGERLVTVRIYDHAGNAGLAKVVVP